ncbi:MAG TPA: hypothetical protein VGM94_01755 [Galbitalea sp.]
MASVRVHGELMGIANDPVRDPNGREVVRVTEEARPDGPADNALILVDRGTAQARYLSWIGYFDLDCAVAFEPDRWTIVEPATTWENEVEFRPFGVPGAEAKVMPAWNGGPTDGLVLPRNGGVTQAARQSRYRGTTR